ARRPGRRPWTLKASTPLQNYPTACRTIWAMCLQWSAQQCKVAFENAIQPATTFRPALTITTANLNDHGSFRRADWRLTINKQPLQSNSLSLYRFVDPCHTLYPHPPPPPPPH